LLARGASPGAHRPGRIGEGWQRKWQRKARQQTEIFGNDMAATAMIDRLIHHAEILSLKGDSYRLRGKDLDARPPRAAG